MVDLIRDFILTFSSVLWEALPFIVLGALVAGLLEELLPQHLITRFMPTSAVPAVIVGGLLGLVFPMCECGILVVMRRLLRKGLPLACCIAYMLAGPIVNVIVLLSTYVAFQPHTIVSGGEPRSIGWDMVLLRAGLGFFVAAMTGLVVHLVARANGTQNLLTTTALPPQKPEVEGTSTPPKSTWTRMSNIASTSLHDFMDITVFLIIGAVLAAVAKLWLGPGTIERISQEQPIIAIPLMMILAALMCLCSEADAFVAASFTKMQVSSKIAFLVLGPMLDLKLLMMYTRVFKPRLILMIVTCVVIQVAIYSTIVHVVYASGYKTLKPPAAVTTPAATTPATTTPATTPTAP